MARTDVTTVKVVRDTDFTPAGVAVDVTNGMRVVGTKLRRVHVLVTNTSAATKVVTVHKATNAQDIPATDYSSIAVPITTGIGILGPFSGRYIQSDGTIWLDFVAGHTGIVAPYEVLG